MSVVDDFSFPDSETRKNLMTSSMDEEIQEKNDVLGLGI